MLLGNAHVVVAVGKRFQTRPCPSPRAWPGDAHQARSCPPCRTTTGRNTWVKVCLGAWLARPTAGVKLARTVVNHRSPRPACSPGPFGDHVQELHGLAGLDVLQRGISESRSCPSMGPMWLKPNFSNSVAGTTMPLACCSKRLPAPAAAPATARSCPRSWQPRRTGRSSAGPGSG